MAIYTNKTQKHNLQYQKQIKFNKNKDFYKNDKKGDLTPILSKIIFLGTLFWKTTIL